MKLRLALPALSLALFACHAVAQAVPAGATGQCKDGTYSTAAVKAGACGGHKGVKTWFAPPAPIAPKPTTTPAPAAATKPTPAPAPATKPAPAPATSTAGAPAGANGQCNDGTYSTAASKSGACGGHKGVKTWFGAATAPVPASKSVAVAPAAPTPAPAPAAKPAPTAAAAPAAKPTTATTAPAAGGGPGMVWVNTATKVYHCPTDRYYGKTKAGKYISESAAVAEGDKPDAGKSCR